MNEIYKYVEITYVDGTQGNIELVIPFEIRLEFLGDILNESWYLVQSVIGAYIINKDQIRCLRFNNDWKES